MKCHYEILNVPRDAGDSEIKTAYRKLALKWHPDKNLDNPDLAKEQFQFVQQAYDVLSDSQERAWYDKHREQILHGGRNNSNYKDDCLDVFQYFTTSCFKGYNDNDDGFYTVYRNVFKKIAAEDIEYMDSEDDFAAIPEFGDSKSNYDTVVGPFYAYWMSYSTKKSYVWLDPYDIRETRDRRVVKLIEKENKKVRAKAKKERNEEVRNLIVFVRKRDKRVQANIKKLEEKALENRKKQEKIRRERLEERKKELSQAKEQQQEWEKFENMKSGLKEIEKHLAAEFGEDLSDSDLSESEMNDNSDEEMDTLTNNLYCAACNKIFKTPKAFENHEFSKKHKENVEKLKLQMLDEQLDVDDLDSDKDTDVSNENNVCISHDVQTKQTADENGIINYSDTSEDKNVQEKTSKKSKKMKKKKMCASFKEDSEDDIDKNEFNLEVDGLSKKQKKKNKREENILSLRRKAQEEIQNQKDLTTLECTVETNDAIAQNDKPINNVETIKTENGLKLNKNDKAPVNRKSKLIANDSTLMCAVCKSGFPSKNKLFDHLKKTGHSIPLTETVQYATKANKKALSKSNKKSVKS